MASKKSEASAEVFIKPIQQGFVTLRIIGTTPLIQNRMSAKAKQQLLLGSKKKTKAEKAEIKHHPLAEFRDSAEMLDVGPTALGLRVVSVKAAMCGAALETEGITKSSAQKLLYMPGDLTPLYGIPQIRMDIVRSADMNRTPDVRSRVTLPKWGAELKIGFIMPQLNPTSVMQLLANAGFLNGVGDFRQEKGKGSFGLFRVVHESQQDDEWDELVATSGRAVQLAALQNPEPANIESAELLEEYGLEVKKRNPLAGVTLVAAE